MWLAPHPFADSRNALNEARWLVDKTVFKRHHPQALAGL